MGGGSIAPWASVVRHPGVRRSRRRLAAEFVRRVAQTPDDRLEALDGARGRLLVSGLFRLMALQLDRDAARRVSAAIEWRVTEADGGATVHTVIVGDGRCSVRRGVVARPDLVLELSTADLLRLAAGLASGPALFGDGRLRLRGDLELALRLPRLFRVPRGPSG